MEAERTGGVKKKPSFISRLIGGFFKTVAALLLIVSAVGAFAAVWANNTLLSRGFYSSVMGGGEYIASLKAGLEEEIETLCKIYNFPYEAVKPASDDKILSELSVRYASGLYDAVFSGTALPTVSYPKEAFLQKIAAYGVVLPPDSIFAEESSQKYLAGYFAEKADYALNSFGQESIIKTANSFAGFRVARLGDMTVPGLIKAAAVPLAGAAAILFLLMLIGKNGKFAYRFYAASGALWCASAVIFVPCMLLRGYDIFGRIPVADSPLKNFLAAFAEAVSGSLFTWSGIFFASASVMLITASVICVTKKPRPASEPAISGDGAEINKVNQ